MPPALPTQHLTAAEQPVGQLTYGIGWNWFDHLGSGGLYARSPLYPLHEPVCPDLNDRAGWAALLGALDDLRPGIIRFGIPPDPHVGTRRGEIRTDTVHLARLDRLNRWAEQNGCAVLLDPFFIPERYEFATEGVTSEWISMAAEDNDAYAQEFVRPLLHHVVVERGLSAVTLFNPVNEPLIYGCYQTPNNRPDMYAHYVDMYRAIDAALKDAGLRSRIRLVGVDCIGAETFPALEFLARGIDIDPYCDLYSIHYYHTRFDWALPSATSDSYPLHEGIDRHTGRVMKHCRERGKPLLAGEVGTFYYGNGYGGTDMAGPARHDAALLVAETVLRSINLGLCGAAFWSLLNPDNVDGRWSVFAVKQSELVKSPHTYALYGLLSRYARPGSAVYPLRPEKREGVYAYVWASALQTPSQGMALIAINDHPCEMRDVTFTLPQGWAGRALTKRCKDGVRQGEAMGTFTVSADGELRDSLTPLSLQVYVEAP